MPNGSERRGGLRRPVLLAALTLAAVAAAALASTPPPASAHPDHLVEPIVVGDFGYSPADVTIRQGSSVQWRWQNSVPRSVTSAPGSPVDFDSGVHTAGDPSFVLRFDEPGTYDYSSKAGSPQIEGTIEVIPLPGVAPKISALRVAGRSKPVARYELNKGAFLVGRIEQRRSGRWRSREALSLNGKPGRNRVALAKDELGRGRFRLSLTAYDRYRREDTARVRFRLR